MTVEPPHINREMLRDMRHTADWRTVFARLGLVRDARKSKPDDWWASSPFAPDSDPSFHVWEGRQGVVFKCWSSGRGGSLLDLIAATQGFTGGDSLKQAGAWLISQGLYHRTIKAPAAERSVAPVTRVKEPACDAPNPAITVDLRPLYAAALHDEFKRRAIYGETCAYLGAGFLPPDSGSPLAGRIVFQVRSGEGAILSHIGRALSEDAAAAGGKWRFYKGFRKALELFNLDHVRGDPRAKQQLRRSHTIIVTEGAFDVAKLVEAGIYNCAGLFGSDLSAAQADRLAVLNRQMHGGLRVALWLDRDAAGEAGTARARACLQDKGLAVDAFDWRRLDCKDVCEAPVAALRDSATGWY